VRKKRKRERERERAGRSARAKKEAKNHLKITVARPLAPAGVLNFLPRGFTVSDSSVHPPVKSVSARAAFFRSRCVSREMTGSQLIRNERLRLTAVQRLSQL